MQKNLGTIDRKKDGFEVRLERILPFSREQVWDAITNPKRLAQWFTDVEMEFKPGGKMIIRFKDENKSESFGEIVRIEQLEVFEYSWEGELATWQLYDEGPTRCRLVLTYSKFADNFAFSVPAGWHVLLDQLEEVLGGNIGDFPFGGEETEKAKRMKAIYRKMVEESFPDVMEQK